MSAADVEGAADEYPTFRSDSGTRHILVPGAWRSVCGHIEAADVADDPKESDDPTPGDVYQVQRWDVPNVVDCKLCRNAQAKAEFEALGVDVDDLDEGDIVRYWAGRPYWEASDGATSHRATGKVRSLPPYERRLPGDEEKTETDRVEIVDEHGGLTFASHIPVDRILEVVDGGSK